MAIDTAGNYTVRSADVVAKTGMTRCYVAQLCKRRIIPARQAFRGAVWLIREDWEAAWDAHTAKLCAEFMDKRTVAIRNAALKRAAERSASHAESQSAP